MSNEEHFEQWSPFPESVGKVTIEGLLDSGDDSFHILIRLAAPSDALFSLRWPARPHAYRNVDESYRLRLWNRVTLGAHCFWIVRSSAWLHEFHYESLDVYAHEPLVHYAIYTDDDCIDVLSVVPPVAQQVQVAAGA